MSSLLKSKTLSVSIECSPRRVYDFISNPENLPKWAMAFCKSVKKSKGEWIVETPEGPMRIKFLGPNELGVLDHYVTVTPGVEVYNPMRVVPNGFGSEVLFTLFHWPGMSDEKFSEDAKSVRRDLETLKKVLEK